MMPDVSIIIVNFNGKEQTRRCLQSLAAVAAAMPYEVIVVDNHSLDGSVEAIRREFPDVILLAQESNLGFGKANNRGAHEAKGRFLFFVNNDTVFTQNVAATLKEFLESDQSAGAAAPMLKNPDGTFQLSYGKFPSLLNELRTKRDTLRITHARDDRNPRAVEWVSFAAVMIRREAFEKIGGFDERYFMYFEDADVCLRLRNAGYATCYCAGVSLIHEGGGSWSSSAAPVIRLEYRRSQILFYTLHRSRIETALLRCYLFFRMMIASTWELSF
jgi:GT2 family glycosyltransferase